METVSVKLFAVEDISLLTKTQNQKPREVSEETSKGPSSFKEILKKSQEASEQEKSALLKAKKKEEESLIFDGAMPPILNSPIHTSFQTLQTGVTKISSLPPEIKEFAEELVPPIISSSKGGVMKIEMRIETKNFAHLDIIIDHYDTAPHSFNIFIKGNDKIDLFFENHQKALALSLKEVMPHFECNLFLLGGQKTSGWANYKKTKNYLVKSKDLSYSADNNEEDVK